MNKRVCVGPMLYMCEYTCKCIQCWVCMCVWVLVSALVGCAMIMTNDWCWLGEDTRCDSFESQTCERACVRLHIVVVMQALMKLAENVLL